MSHWNTRGLRGSSLEEFINLTNSYYGQKGLAVIQKIPTPIKPIKINSETKTITLAYFEQQSTVDYIGVAQGIPICFDAKETNRKSLPISHIHQHQIEFMRQFEQQKGICFLLVHFVIYSEFYFFPFKKLYYFYKNSLEDGRKSIPYDEFDKKYKINLVSGVYINYLEAVDRYLSESNFEK